MKSIATVKQPKQESGVEFRWSTSIIQLGLSEKDSLLNFHLENSQQKAFPSTSKCIRLKNKKSPINIFYLVRNPSKSISPLSISPSSPRLPNINKMKKKTILSNSTNEVRQSPLSLTYFQLHHAQMKTKSQASYSLSPLSNNKQNRMSIVAESPSQEQLTHDEYIRLHTSQLKRLHVSDKYMKEAKKLYFNPASKVFVPRRSIVEIS